MLTVYLTITLCLIQNPGVCKELNFQNNEASVHSCAMEGMSQTMKLLKKDGETWQIKKWRCSHQRPDMGV